MVIQRKVLKGTHMQIEMKEIQAGYLHNSCFKDIYIFLSENKLPSSKVMIRKIEAISKNIFY